MFGYTPCQEIYDDWVALLIHVKESEKKKNYILLRYHMPRPVTTYPKISLNLNCENFYNVNHYNSCVRDFTRVYSKNSSKKNLDISIFI